MSHSYAFEFCSDLMDGMRQALAESAAGLPVESGMQVVGLFRVRKTLAVSQTVQDIVTAVLRGDKDIRINGIRIVVPVSRRHEFTPALPVFVAVLGTELNVSVSSVELTKDPESEQPALLITTESSLKPDVLLVLSVLPEQEHDTEPVAPSFPVSSITERLLIERKVPARHHHGIRIGTSHAWSEGIVAAKAAQLPKTGMLDTQQLERVARAVVEQLVEDKVVSAGLFFWLNLGYYLIKIIAALIDAQHSQSNQAAGEYQGQSTVLRFSGN